MVKVRAFVDGSWEPVQSVNIFHHGLGFVAVNAIKVHDGAGWVTVSFPDGSSRLVQQKELIGA